MAPVSAPTFDDATGNSDGDRNEGTAEKALPTAVVVVLSVSAGAIAAGSVAMVVFSIKKKKRT